MKTLLSTALLCGVLTGCKSQQTTNPHGAMAEPGGTSGSWSDPHAVALRLTRVSPGTSYAGQWTVAEASSANQPLFRIELKEAESNQSFAFGKGSFLAVKGANGKSFLAHLHDAMEAKRAVGAQKHQDKIDVTDAILGTNMSRIPQGGFQEQPKGDWAAIKIFLPAGDDQAEVFFNINVKTGEAELAEKDADYGDEVLSTFAKLFAPN